MRHKLLYSIVLNLTFSILLLHSQKAVLTVGGNANGEGSISYSVGQVAFTQMSNDNFSLTTGVQQAYIIEEVSNHTIKDKLEVNIKLYPNPTSDNIILHTEFEKPVQLSYKLFDFNGSLIRLGEISTNATIISLSEIKPATYLLKVFSDNKEIKTYKLIKN